jgi:hypothetical protein
MSPNDDGNYTELRPVCSILIAGKVVMISDEVCWSTRPIAYLHGHMRMEVAERKSIVARRRAFRSKLSLF